MPFCTNLAPCGGCGEQVGSVHQCFKCGVNIHPFCGVGIGEEEYGQAFICPHCSEAGASLPLIALDDSPILSDKESEAHLSSIALDHSSILSDKEAPHEPFYEFDRFEVCSGSSSGTEEDEQVDVLVDSDDNTSEEDENFEVDDNDDLELDDSKNNLPLQKGWQNIVAEVKKLHWQSGSLPAPDVSTKQSRINKVNIRNARREVDVFLELFPFDLFEEICHWSNIYKNKKAKE